MSAIASLFVFLGFLPEIWKWYQEFHKKQQEISFLNYLQKARDVYGKLENAKGKEEIINAAIQIQRLMHSG